MKKRLRSNSINTVCESARCPNIGECFNEGVATFMILGEKCTRSCGFCSVDTLDLQDCHSNIRCDNIDQDEPKRVAGMAKDLGLKHVVITSVTRDDLPDGGALQFAETIKEIRKLDSNFKVEVLVPDFRGDPDSVRCVVEANPDVFSHNLETVTRLYPEVRPQANYYRSLQVLAFAKELNPQLTTKSSIMVGLGEKEDEVIDLMHDLRKINCDTFCIGHYLRPTKRNLKVVEHISQEQFAIYEGIGYKLGFKNTFSAPFVRSSYKAKDMLNDRP